MGTTANPMFSGLVPGANPTGNMISLTDTGRRSSADNPLLRPMTTAGPSSPVSTSPYDVVPTSSTLTANTGPYPSSLNLGSAGGPAGTQFGGFLGGMTSKDIGRLFGSLKKTYGDGMAHLILDFLQGGAGFNQQAINNLLASLQPGIERGKEGIIEQFSAMGNRFGSPAAIGLGDYLSQVSLEEGQLITQMYEDSLNRFMEVMMGTAGKGAERISSSPGIFDSILGGLKIGGAAAGAASAAGVGGTPGTVLDMIAAAGGAV